MQATVATGEVVLREGRMRLELMALANCPVAVAST